MPIRVLRDVIGVQEVNSLVEKYWFYKQEFSSIVLETAVLKRVYGVHVSLHTPLQFSVAPSCVLL